MRGRSQRGTRGGGGARGIREGEEKPEGYVRGRNQRGT